jgi:MinD-like ATPase involved in chromosome partitioning or flagellar assembly
MTNPSGRCRECGSASLGTSFCMDCGAPIESAVDEHTFTREALAPLITAAKQLSMPEDPPSGREQAVAVEYRASPTAASTPQSAITPVGLRPRNRAAREGVRGRLSRLGIPVSPGRPERRHRALEEQLTEDEYVVAMARWSRPVGILVANPKGGVGKTPTAVLLADVLASVRGGSVCVIEVSDDPGALSFRAEGNPALGLGELVRNVRQVVSSAELASYAARQTSSADVIGSIGPRERLTRDNVIELSDVVDRFFSIRVMDSGNQVSSPAFRAAVERADVLVIPVLNAADAILEAVSLLEELRASGDAAARLADRAVFVRLSDGRVEHPQLVERVQRVLTADRPDGLVDVPYDEHIAARGQLTLRALAPETYRAFASVAAGVVRSLHALVQ